MNQLAKEIAKWRKEKGFITNWENIPEKLMLVVTELSEAMEAYRNNDKENLIEELSDSFIRLLDLTGSLDIDIEKGIKEKMEINKKRPFRHGKLC